MLASIVATQLQNKGEQGDVTYAEAVPWLEVASFGGFLATIEVMIAFFLVSRVWFPLQRGLLQLQCSVPSFAVLYT